MYGSGLVHLTHDRYQNTRKISSRVDPNESYDTMTAKSIVSVLPIAHYVRQKVLPIAY